MVPIEKRFQAAVNVIHSLPKNGPFQPSTGVKLKFYGLYKQATEGVCKQTKPAFWDVIGVAKWKSWNKRSDLSKEEAMQQYVDSFRELIENLTLSQDVQNSAANLNDLDSLNLDELELIVPGVRRLAENHAASSFTTGYQSDLETQELSTFERNNSVGTLETSDDEFSDPMDFQNEAHTALMQNVQILKQIDMAINRMNLDIATLKLAIEDTRLQLQQVTGNRSSTGENTISRQFHKYWPLENISPIWFMVLLLWPFVAKRFYVIFTNINSKRKYNLKI